MCLLSITNGLDDAIRPHNHHVLLLLAKASAIVRHFEAALEQTLEHLERNLRTARLRCRWCWHLKDADGVVAFQSFC